MLSYRHAFHAGNHADVLKHLVEVLVLQHMVQKGDKPLCYIDTHAGPGIYDLRGAFASKNREFDSGIERLWQRNDLPPPLQHYMDLVRGFNAGGELVQYPGSPAIAATILHTRHRLRLFELHSGDAAKLARWGGCDRRVKVQQGDGFAVLKAILPPPEKRALVMIDPPYELKTDYATALRTLQLASKKFATGVYALWYPLLARKELATLVRKLEAMPVRSLMVELPVRAKGVGMHGSGVFVVNPPWMLQQQLESCMPYLQAMLASADALPWRLRCSGE